MANVASRSWARAPSANSAASHSAVATISAPALVSARQLGAEGVGRGDRRVVVVVVMAGLLLRGPGVRSFGVRPALTR